MMDIMKMLRARKYMKRNEPFLASWHAYIGYEMGLFTAFERPFTVEDVADAYGIDEVLLEQWVKVGLSIGHLKEAGRNRYRLKNRWKLPKPKGQNSSGIILKEMMELHIPALLSYPDIMRGGERNHFDERRHADMVAETSRLLEVAAIGKVARQLRDLKTGTVLDLGCGEGGYIKMLAKRFPQIQFIGVEVSDSVAATAREVNAEQPNVEIVCSDLWDFEPDGDADVILMNNVLHYIPLDQRAKLFGRLSDWLNDNGVLAIVTPIAGHADSPPFAHAFNSFFLSFDNLYRLPAEDELKRWGVEAGFDFLGFQTVVKEGSWYIAQYRKEFKSA
ncbi:class I SAM-dependent methyltransferase [Planococcus lenghuensis]|uniref:Methyltransferase type 12 n=1 Tax=Planococcus lenghuensis TaxID=2213202 RepID=A0A1Q2KW89_9BACL|nr:class I SAM-dependent methyltransferase [Planococcus lenghuensis]AQQ52485.1 methyltransferase type 12 [Planococcus lenghuensis]